MLAKRWIRDGKKGLSGVMVENTDFGWRLEFEAGHTENRVDWLRAAKESRERFVFYAHFIFIV